MNRQGFIAVLIGALLWRGTAFFMGGLAVLAILCAIFIAAAQSPHNHFDVEFHQTSLSLTFERGRVLLAFWKDHGTPPQPATPGLMSLSRRAEATTLIVRNRRKDWHYECAVTSRVAGRDPSHPLWLSESFAGRNDAIDIKKWRGSGEAERCSFWRTRRAILVPNWFPPVLFGTPVVLWLLFVVPRGIRYAHRLSRQQCTTCGYQLRVENPYCPECGWLRERYMGSKTDFDAT
jgi:hypothetical protein